MGAIHVTDLLKGTFIEEVFEAMQNGQAHDDMEGVKDNEKVVGQMNELEKALNFLRHKYIETHERIISRLRGEGKPYSLEEKKKLIDEINTCRARYKLANDLMWENIETRLADHKSPLCTGWAIRSGHQIVLVFGDKAPDFPDNLCVILLKK